MNHHDKQPLANTWVKGHRDNT